MDKPFKFPSIFDEKTLEYPFHSLMIEKGLCLLPILAKYAYYAIESKTKRPSDEVVDDLFDSIYQTLHAIIKEKVS